MESCLCTLLTSLQAGFILARPLDGVNYPQLIGAYSDGCSETYHYDEDLLEDAQPAAATGYLTPLPTSALPVTTEFTTQLPAVQTTSTNAEISTNVVRLTAAFPSCYYMS